MKRMMATMVTIAMALVFWVAPCGAADVAKIGVIDFQRFLVESDIGKSAQAKIASEGQKMEDDLKQKGEKIQTLQNNLERDAMVMSGEKREEKQRQYRIEINDLKSLQQKYKRNFQEMEQRLIGRIQKKAFNMAEALGKKEGYLLIIEKTAAIYYPAAIDVTDKLIEMANAEDLSLTE